MKILYYSWEEIIKDDIYETLKDCGHEVELLTLKMNNYVNDPEFVNEFEKILKGSGYDAIFTMNYFPVISKISLRNEITYISWIYDSPCITLYSQMVHNPYNYVFHFDKDEVNKLRGYGVKNIYHLPLAVNAKRLTKCLDEMKDIPKELTNSGVSFMGNLYNDEFNFLDSIKGLDNYTIGVLEGIIDAQLCVTDNTLIEEAIPERIMVDLLSHVEFNLEDEFFVPNEKLLLDMMYRKATVKERTRFLEKISEKYPTTLYSNKTDDKLKKVDFRGYINYSNQMPYMFNNSAINLNISLRCINSGIPLRCMDIMGAGGFLLTDYQPELAEYFVDGQDLVMYYSLEDCLDKIDYYLSHEEEREQIALNGQKKVFETFSYKQAWKVIFDTVFNNMEALDSYRTIDSNSEDITDIRDTDRLDGLENSLPLVSVIIPCYNVEKYIDDCMESLINQTIGLDKLEIILVDDCSTDNTVDKLKEYEAKYPDNILLVLSEKNGRQGTARNIGLSYARGKYISFVDSDDWVHHDMFRVLEKVISETGCDVVTFQHEIKKEKDIDVPIETVVYDTYNYSDNRKEYLFNADIMNESCWSKIYRRSMVAEAGVSYAQGVAYEEPLFTYPLKFYASKVCVIKDKLYNYRFNESGTMLSYMQKPNTILEHLQVQQQVYDFVKSKTFYNEYKNEIDLYFIHTFYAENFFFMRSRGFMMPVALFKYMTKSILAQIPDYKHNPYINPKVIPDEYGCIELIEKLNDKSDDYIQEELNRFMENG